MAELLQSAETSLASGPVCITATQRVISCSLTQVLCYVLFHIGPLGLLVSGTDMLARKSACSCAGRPNNPSLELPPAVQLSDTKAAHMLEKYNAGSDT